jgi:hypothetical protein
VLNCPVGLILGIVAFYRPLEDWLGWAVAIGVLGSLSIPTIWVPYLRAV